MIKAIIAQVSNVVGRIQAVKTTEEFYKNKTVKSGLHYECKKCSAKRHKEYTQTNKGKESKRKAQRKYSKSMKGKEIRAKWRRGKSGAIRRLLKSARERAKKKSLNCDLDYNIILKILDSSGWRCALSNIPFDLTIKKPRDIYKISIDKINPSKGYTKDNTRFILFGLNAFKGSNNDKELLDIVKTVYKKNLQENKIISEFS